MKQAITLVAVTALLTACASAPASRPSAGGGSSGGGGFKPATALDTNAAGRALIKEDEGLRLESYFLYGLELIGYGHLMKDGEPDKITEAQAETLLTQDLASCETTLEKALTTTVSSNEFSALASLCYNIGTGNVRTSSAITKLNAGDRAGAAEAILLWNKANGKVDTHLVERRKRERALFLTP